jgi:predicted Na+-dependent transporter
MTLQKFAGRYMSLILFAACLVGLFTPDIGHLTAYAILFLLFVIIFFSFFQLDLRRESFMMNLQTSVWFSIVRFVVLPALVFFAIKPFSGFYAFAVFFLMLMPAGVSSPALTAMYRANMNLSLLILVFSSLIGLLSIPFLAPFFFSGAGQIKIIDLLKTLLITVVLPFLLHLPLRRNKKLTGWVNANLSVITVVSLCFLFILAIARNKAAILGNPSQLLWYSIIAIILYGSLYFSGWKLLFRMDTSSRISGSASSGMNNIGLAVSLAALYLPAEYTVFFITSEFAWVGVIYPAKLWFRKSTNVSTQE